MYFLTLLALFLAYSIPSFAEMTPASFVNPFIGTAAGIATGQLVSGGSGGATFPGAVVPFGLAQIGPDTDHPETSGYNYQDSSISRFSLTHMSGPGCRNMGEVAFMPFINQARWPSKSETFFTHANERAIPGFYEVQLSNGIQVGLTATERAAIAQFNFLNISDNSNVGVVFNTGLTGVGTSEGHIEFTTKHSMIGSVSGGHFCGNKGTYQVYFAVEFNQDSLQNSFSNNLAQITFASHGEPLLMKVGISLVSKENALKNLNSEIPNFSFELVRQNAFNKWNQALSTVLIDDKTSTDKKTTFYTALYHSLLHPNIGSDVDGSYLGFDNKVHIDSTRPHYVNFSGWDIYRSQVQLLAFLFPKRASDIAQSLVDQGLQGGALPKWSLNNIETNIMTGDPGSLIVSNMYAFGARNFDTTSALNLMKKSALDPNASTQGYVVRVYMDQYINNKYIQESTDPINYSSASVTLEYASADFAVGNFAYRNGDLKFANEMVMRSTKWRYLWDASTKLVRPKDKYGDWIEPFDKTTQKGFMEGNSAQYTWMVPHDLSTLVSAMGGDEALTTRLDDFLSQSNAGQNSANLYLGNEPSFVTPWIYLWAHKPEKAQQAVRKLVNEQFGTGPNGLTGNDDLGALSSWYVWSSLGMFPAVPGIGGVIVGSPVFESFKITPENESAIQFYAPNANDQTYVESVKVNSLEIQKTWIKFSDLKLAKEITFKMNSQPQNWGKSIGSEPPSLMQGKPIVWPIE